MRLAPRDAALACCCCLSVASAAAQTLEDYRVEAPLASPAAAAPGLALRDEGVRDKAVRKAVKESLAESGSTLKPSSGRVLSGDKYEQFGRDFSEAEKPGCLRPDAMKFQPHSLNFKLFGQEYVAEATGKIAIPFWIAAIVRGKCN